MSVNIKVTGELKGIRIAMHDGRNITSWVVGAHLAL